MARIVVIGSDGQLGFDLMRSAAAADEVVGLTHKDIEVADAESVSAALRRVQPEVVINTAAITKTEACEQSPEDAYRVNAVGAYHVARAAEVLGAVVVYVSTDYVFDGAKSVFTEDDLPNPLNVYGASKLAGEHLTKIANPKHYIIRSSWLFGKNVSHKGYNFVTLMLKLAKEGKEIRVVRDQQGSPTFTQDLAEKIYETLRRGAPFGVYHLTNQGVTTWHGFAEEIFRRAGVDAKPIPITTSESGSKIKRPASSLLRDAKLQALDISPLRPWQEALGAYLDEMT